MKLRKESLDCCMPKFIAERLVVDSMPNSTSTIKEEPQSIEKIKKSKIKKSRIRQYAIPLKEDKRE